ncbi:GTP cyclohydrolase II [Chryseobacterium shigense]|uniref:GTP cyclohydrolase-2 n=1 Tax=Chryseobacterium shigense TaxID=297244 RepID=A0A841ND51_9FLAO|nr:GTP cyclohydrolase II [Chryseobacterium shigense]MBB6372631.1 GTP cyclohydrolase II [Chryseobacterium shigense]
MKDSNDILFYDEDGLFFEFSNFYPLPVKIDGAFWLTSEHFYQAQKFINDSSKEKIRLAKTAEEAYLLGNNLQESRVDNWENRRVQIMERAVYEKFSQHDFLKEKLLETGELLIKENSPTDSFWGIGSDGLGKNVLGRILMDIRNKFKNLEEAKQSVKPKWMCIEDSVEIPTEYGKMFFNVYMDHKGKEHLAIISGNIDVDEHVLVRIHSECITGDVFKSSKCDCGIQLDRAFKFIGEETQKGKGGIILYMRDEGRGIGLGNKLRAYKFQQQGFDTIDANKIIQTPVDDRNYVLPSQILKSLGINKVRLITNNPLKIKDLENEGIEVKRVKINSSVTPFNKDYLSVKNNIMGHNIGIDY